MLLMIFLALSQRLFFLHRNSESAIVIFLLYFLNDRPDSLEIFSTNSEKCTISSSEVISNPNSSKSLIRQSIIIGSEETNLLTFIEETFSKNFLTEAFASFLNPISDSIFPQSGSGWIMVNFI